MYFGNEKHLLDGASLPAPCSSVLFSREERGTVEDPCWYGEYDRGSRAFFFLRGREITK